MLLVDKIGDSRLIPLHNGSVNLNRLQIQFHHTWYSTCGNLQFFYGKFGLFEDHCSLNTIRDADSDSRINSTHVVLIYAHNAYKYITIVEGNCSTYGLPETRYFCQKRKFASLYHRSYRDKTFVKFKLYQEGSVSGVDTHSADMKPVICAWPRMS